MLTSDELSGAIEQLRQRYDIILIDAPSAADARNLAAVRQMADVSVAVLRAGSANYADVRSVEQSGDLIVVNAVARPGILTLWK